MSIAMSGGEALGGLYLLILIGGFFALVWWFERKFGAKFRQKQRDNRIEAAMRYGMYDAEAQERIAKKLMEERFGSTDYER